MKKFFSLVMAIVVFASLFICSNIIAFADTTRTTITDVSSTATSITFKWKKISGAKSYEVALVSRNGTVIRKSSVGNVLKHTFKSLDPARYYRIQARAKLKSAAWSKSVLYYTSYITGNLTQINPIKNNQFTVKWNKVAGVKYYGIYYASKNEIGKFTCRCITTSNSFTGKGITNSNVAEFYYMRVLPLSSNKAPIYNTTDYIYSQMLRPKVIPGTPNLHSSDVFLNNYDCDVSVSTTAYHYPNNVALFKFYSENKVYIGSQYSNGLGYSKFPKSLKNKIQYITVQVGQTINGTNYYSAQSKKVHVGN